MSDRAQRKLAAIVAADVVGYSRMMAVDESRAIEAVQRLQHELIEPLLPAYGGRIVKTMGDGFLMEFASVVDGVEAAIRLQEGLEQANRELTEESRVLLRVGIHVGDIVVEGLDIFGDGVNVAARIEPLASPGGIGISDEAYRQVRDRLDMEWTDGGTQIVKNMARPLQVWHWNNASASPRETPEQQLHLPDRPSIAVLPFDNMSSDPEQEYFSDGISADIITELSHFKEFSVIARNSTFTFKGKAMRADQICGDLGVRYLVEGSVRKVGRSVRVTAQLIDGKTNAHLWAGKFDRELDDIFAVQDEITQAIVGAVAPETLGAELKRSRSKGGLNLTAWERVLQARWHLGQFSRDGNVQARKLLEQAIANNPGFADAHTALAHCDLMDMLHLWCSDVPAAIKSAEHAGREAVALDDTNAEAHTMLAMSLLFGRNFADCEAHLNRAVDLNLNLANAWGIMTVLHGIEHQFDRARETFDRAIRLSPRDPLKAFWLGALGIGAFIAEEYEECVAIAERGIKEHPGYASLMRQEAAALGMLGRLEEAAASVDRLLQRIPGLTLSQARHMVAIRRPDDHERWLEGLRRAGLPE